LAQHFHDFGNDINFYNRLVEIVNNTFVKNEKGLGDSIIASLTQEREKFGNRAKKELQFSEQPPEPLIPISDNFEDFDPIEVARQLCLFDQELLRDIEPKECLGQAWNKDKENAPHIRVMIDFFNNFSSFVTTKVCSYDKAKERGKMIQKFLDILAVLRENNNFNSAQSILAGLNSSAVYRMSISWAHARKDRGLVEVFEETTRILSSDGSYGKFRKTVKTINPPCIPYIGVYLTDLTFIEDGNPKFLVVEPERDDIINFEKMRKVAVVIQEIILFQQKPYNFEKVEPIQNFFEKIVRKEGCLDEMTNYQRSRTVEEKEDIDEFNRKQQKKERKFTIKKTEKTTEKPPTPPTIKLKNSKKNLLSKKNSKKNNNNS